MTGTRIITRAWKPSFQIEFLGCSVVQRSRNDVDNPVGDVEGLVKSLGVANHFVHHLPRQVVVWRRDAKLLHLVGNGKQKFHIHPSPMTVEETLWESRRYTFWN